MEKTTIRTAREKDAWITERKLWNQDFDPDVIVPCVVSWCEGEANGYPIIDYDTEPLPDYDLTNIANYAVKVFAHRFAANKPTSLGEDIAYAALKAALGNPLTKRQKELVEQHTRNGRISP